MTADPDEGQPTAATSDGERLIAGRYRLLSELGGGAMGVVWRARDEVLGRDVAVKQLRPDTGMSGAQVRQSHLRARREGRIAARLQHPNAVTIFDVAEHDGRPYLIMEYVPSSNLADILATGTVMTPEEVARFGAQLSSALAAAHAVGIVHRDIKPGNVLMTSDGTVKLTDFGISRATGDATVTATGEILGTPAYTAPEVAQGHAVDSPADVFSLGATLYAAVEGTPPFGDDVNAMAVLLRVVRNEMRAPRRTGMLTDTVLRMLDPEPANRPTMKEVSQALSALGTSPLPAVEAPTRVDRAAMDRTVVDRSLTDRSVADRAVVAPAGGDWAGTDQADADWAGTGRAGADRAGSERADADWDVADRTGATPDAPPPSAAAVTEALALEAVAVPLPTSKPVPDPMPVPAPEAASVPEVASIPEAASEPEAEPDPAPKAEPKPKQTTKPKPAPEPAPKPTAALPVAEPTTALPETSPTTAMSAAGAGGAGGGATTAMATTRPGDSSRRRLIFAGAGVGSAAVIAGIVVALSGGGGDHPSATTAAQSTTTPHTSASTAPSSPPSTQPTTPATSSAAAPPASSPSSAPSSTPATSASSSSADVTTQLAAAITNYYTLVPGNLQQAWNDLTPEFQKNKALGWENYQSFWNGMERVTVTGVQAKAPDTVIATVNYFPKNGANSQERTTFTLVQDGGVWKIARTTTG